MTSFYKVKFSFSKKKMKGLCIKEYPHYPGVAYMHPEIKEGVCNQQNLCKQPYNSPEKNITEFQL